ncbi:hypothetical protein [uncultured Sulfitobacter sp.]|uniref:hypothetical protein n=1 Tax=uncultured Sulfitobacter sp. TaxID=191468 RepID=UPI002598BA3A|nr:hypothetical protein [uncultured Sulfitobacter sp.]
MSDLEFIIRVFQTANLIMAVLLGYFFAPVVPAVWNEMLRKRGTYIRVGLFDFAMVVSAVCIGVILGLAPRVLDHAIAMISTENRKFPELALMAQISWLGVTSWFLAHVRPLRTIIKENGSDFLAALKKSDIPTDWPSIRKIIGIALIASLCFVYVDQVSMVK